MALDGHLKLVGQLQGWIRGSVTQKGREGLIRVRAAEHLATSPFDPVAQQFTGQRVLSPFSIVKEVDAASIGLRVAHAGNELFSEWELKLWQPSRASSSASGIERNHFTVKLTGARVQQIRFVLPDNRDPALAARLDCEEVAFVFAKIEWIWNEPRASHTDMLAAAGRVRRKR
jgi:type VI secretion system secreted protein Hcp